MIDPAHLARNLAGVAVVIHVTDPEVTWDIADETGGVNSLALMVQHEFIGRAFKKPTILAVIAYSSGLGSNR